MNGLRANVPWQASAAAAIGVDWLLAATAPAGEFGRRQRIAISAFGPGEESAAQAAIEAVVRFARAAGGEKLAALHVALAAAPDPSSALTQAVAGEVLADVDFFEVLRFSDALDEVRSLAGDEVTALVLPQGDARARAALAPGRTGARSFYLADAFSPELAAARALANERQAVYDTVRGGLVARIARALGLEHLRDGEFTLLREDLRGPLPPEVRVRHEAPTYLACELTLDAPALAALAARDEAAARVAEAEEAMRARLSRIVGEAAPALLQACAALGDLDVLVARARFALRHAAVVPVVAETGAALEFDEARYLPLAEALAERGREYSPISLRLEGTAIVTGPNMGGKSAALRTCGFVAACVALGLPVPASAASVPLFDEIAWIGIARETHGDSGPGERRLLSSFGAEVGALREFLERGALRPLVLIDEFARTTSPREGRALLVSLLEVLRERNCRALAATHLHGIAREAAVAHYAIAGLRRMPPRERPPLALEAALDAIGDAMDYRLRPGDEDERETGRGDALALADVLGLDAGLIARARAELARAALRT